MYIYCIADTLDKDDGGGERRCFIFIVSPLCISGWAPALTWEETNTTTGANNRCFLKDKDNLLKWERHFHPCPLIGLQETEGHLELVVWHFDWFLIFSDPNHPPGCRPLMIYSSTELLLNDVDPNFQYQSWHIRRWIQEEAISDWRRHQFKTYSKVLAFSSIHSVTNSGRLVCSFHLSFPTIVKENTRQVPRLTW